MNRKDGIGAGNGTGTGAGTGNGAATGSGGATGNGAVRGAAIGVATAWLIVCELYVDAYGKMLPKAEAITDNNTRAYNAQIIESGIYDFNYCHSISCYN